MTFDFRLSLFVFSMFLVGCPQGTAKNVFGRDGGDAGDDAEAGVAEENDASASGALCGVDGKNECGALLLCDEKLGCVECRSDDDCPIAAARCLRGSCVGCRPRMSDCPEGDACSTADFECHPRCVDTRDCAAGTVCDESSGECVGCFSREGCAGKECSTEMRQCVECTSDESCPKSKPRCRVLTGECVRCRSNDDCGVAAPICDPITFACRAPESEPVSDAGATDASHD